jgi:hypothetical protein
VRRDLALRLAAGPRVKKQKHPPAAAKKNVASILALVQPQAEHVPIERFGRRQIVDAQAGLQDIVGLHPSIIGSRAAEGQQGPLAAGRKSAPRDWKSPGADPTLGSDRDEAWEGLLSLQFFNMGSEVDHG